MNQAVAQRAELLHLRPVAGLIPAVDPVARQRLHEPAHTGVTEVEAGQQRDCPIEHSGLIAVQAVRGQVAFQANFEQRLREDDRKLVVPGSD